MPNPKPKKRFLIFGFPILLLFILFLALFFWWTLNLQPVDKTTQTEITMTIPSGASASQIAQILQDNNLIKSKLVFRLYLKREKLDAKLKPGKYQLSQTQSLAEIVNLLQKGVLEDFWVTIPEGKRREEVAKILADSFTRENLVFSIPDFLELTDDLEGYLFPDTYLIPRTTTTQEVVQMMKDNFAKKISNTIKAKANNLDLSFDQVLILASLVEREAKFETDRTKIAGVLLNRLKQDMPLQIDATVQYVVGGNQCEAKIGKDCNWWPVITDTKINSTYNTYENVGLPPAPICNPGLSVIEAVLNPGKHDYLYYLSEDNGTTHYAKTLEEHEANIEKYLNN
ncbi:endolytic transglycosylase MltG [Candidatus Beckwithbacteria bacterium]|nr:endolytic transglycosylase MltG [Candidatus Beckwithbacteria bacterium]